MKNLLTLLLLSISLSTTAQRIAWRDTVDLPQLKKRGIALVATGGTLAGLSLLSSCTYAILNINGTPSAKISGTDIALLTSAGVGSVAAIVFSSIGAVDLKMYNRRKKQPVSLSPTPVGIGLALKW